MFKLSDGRKGNKVRALLPNIKNRHQDAPVDFSDEAPEAEGLSCSAEKTEFRFIYIETDDQCCKHSHLEGKKKTQNKTPVSSLSVSLVAARKTLSVIVGMARFLKNRLIFRTNQFNSAMRRLKKS